MTCVRRIFNKLRQINSTLFILPDSVSELFEQEDSINEQIDNLDDIHHQIDDGYYRLLSINDTLNSLPDFDDLRDKLQSGISFPSILSVCL